MSKMFFLLKFGSYNNIKSLAQNGEMFFSPANKFVQMELCDNNKGQGDRFEGKSYFPILKAEMNDIVNNKLIFKRVGPQKILFSNEYISQMVIYCMTRGTKESIKNFIDDKNFTICLDDGFLNQIKDDFSNPESVVIIPEPHKFKENCINTFDDGNFICDDIKYIKQDINGNINLDYLKSVFVPQMEERNNSIINIKIKDDMMCLYPEYSYRPLLVKDPFFKYQKEFRCIIKCDKNKAKKGIRKIINHTYSATVLDFEKLYNDIKVIDGKINLPTKSESN